MQLLFICLFHGWPFFFLRKGNRHLYAACTETIKMSWMDDKLVLRRRQQWNCKPVFICNAARVGPKVSRCRLSQISQTWLVKSCQVIASQNAAGKLCLMPASLLQSRLWSTALSHRSAMGPAHIRGFGPSCCKSLNHSELGPSSVPSPQK